jgi:mono/diheme cytochrome c family protein
LGAVVREGLDGMPGFPEARIPEAQLADLIAFVRGLRKRTPGSGEAAPTPTEVPVLGQMTWAGSYSRDIQPIFDEYCTRCHGPTLAENGLRLDTYEGVMQGTRGGAVVIPGSAGASTLVWVIQGLAAPEIRMPHSERPLSPNRIQNIVLWIDAGALDD